MVNMMDLRRMYPEAADEIVRLREEVTRLQDENYGLHRRIQGPSISGMALDALYADVRAGFDGSPSVPPIHPDEHERDEEDGIPPIHLD